MIISSFRVENSINVFQAHMGLNPGPRGPGGPHWPDVLTGRKLEFSIIEDSLDKQKS